MKLNEVLKMKNQLKDTSNQFIERLTFAQKCKKQQTISLKSELKHFE